MNYHIKTIANIIRKNIDREPETFGWDRWAQGSAQYRDRLTAVVRYCINKWPGDLVEIGAMAGNMTAQLAATGRQVIVIDPWEAGTQNCEGWEYEVYLKKTKEFSNIETLRVESQDKEAFEYLEGRELCFALVDGLHEYEAALSDMELVKAAPVICVDDILWNKSVEKAFMLFGETRAIVRSPLCKEGYIVSG